MHTFLYKLDAAVAPDIIRRLEEIAEFKGRQDLYLRTEPETLEILHETASNQSTAASGEIEGIHVPPARLDALLAGRSMPRSRPEEETAGYRDALREIDRLGDAGSTIIAPGGVTPRTILALHAELYKYTTAPSAGRWKTKDNVIEAKTESGEVLGVVFYPPPAASTPRFVESLCEEFAKTREKKTVPPLISIAAFILDFLCIHPFDDGNGRIARLLGHLLLLREGYVVSRYVPLERLILETKEAYYAALRGSSDRWHDGTHDPDHWTRYLLDVLLRAYRELEGRVSAVEKAGGRLGALIRDAAISRRDFAIPELTAAFPKASRAYIYRVVNDLIREGRLLRRTRGHYRIVA